MFKVLRNAQLKSTSLYSFTLAAPLLKDNHLLPLSFFKHKLKCVNSTFKSNSGSAISTGSCQIGETWASAPMPKRHRHLQKWSDFTSALVSGASSPRVGCTDYPCGTHETWRQEGQLFHTVLHLWYLCQHFFKVKS